MRKLSLTILCVIVYAFAVSIANQVTTLIGYYNGFYENNDTARFLFSSVGPGGETIAYFALPIIATWSLYKYPLKPADNTKKRLTITTIALVVLIQMEVQATIFTITDYNKLHAYQLL